MLTVMAVVGLLAALTIPHLASPAPSRKAAAYELVRVLEVARSTAEAEEREILVAFTDGQPQTESFQFRAYAIFGFLENESIVQLSNWSFLPRGLVFGNSEHFASPTGIRFETVFDIDGKQLFPIKSGVSNAVEFELPYLSFHPDGGVSHPPIWQAFASNVSIVEGVSNPRSNSVTLTNQSNNGLAQGEIISIAYQTGSVRVITD